MRVLGPLQAFDPTQIGPYKVVGLLGAGAMGRVYLAKSRSSRTVAVKTIRSDLATDADYRRRFAQEVNAARRVNGAFTAAVVDADPDAELPWLATVYVPAPSLAVLVESCGPLPVPAVRWLAAGCAEALDSIHQAGLIHRDLKPGNILVETGGPKLIDFGLARADGLQNLTGTGEVMGTPSFMAPEQVSGGGSPVTAAADVFSLGATLLYAATGHSPFHAKNSAEALLMLMTQEPDLSGVPDGLRTMLTGCLSRNPADRPTPAALVEYLAPYLDETDDAAPPLPPEAVHLIEEFGRGSYTQPVNQDWESDWDSELDRFMDRRAPHPSLGPEHQALHQAARRGRQTGAIGVAVALVAAGLAGGVLYGTSHKPAAGTAQTPPSAGAQGQGQPAAAGLGQDPELPPPPPQAIWQSGTLVLAVNPPYGSQDTPFIIHGSGWPAGRHVTMSIVGGRTSPVPAVPGANGIFDYTIDQQDQLFAGAIPPGSYKLKAVYGSVVATVIFEVVMLQPTGSG
jgi:serine/threonine protein kinase